MAVKQSAFASNAERENFYKLSRQWGNRLHIYHNLPFFNIFDPIDLASISDEDKARLKKTSIDYVVCSIQDKPLLCIEFDGWQQGFNIGTKYKALQQKSNHSWREKITELKLNIAYASKFPFFVVNSSYFEYITDNLRLTFVDGIIGDVVARLDMARLIEANPPQSGDDFLFFEISTQMKHNPIWQKSAELLRNLRGVYRSWSVKPITDPPLTQNVTDFFERTKMLKTALREGAEVVLHTDRFGDISAKVLLPKFDSPGYSGGLGLAEEMAMVLALTELQKKFQTGF